MELPEEPAIPISDFDESLIPRLYKDGGLKKVDQVLDLFRANSALYLDLLLGRVPKTPVKDPVADEMELLDRLKQLALRVGASRLAMLCEDLAEAVGIGKKPLQKADQDKVELAVQKARQYVDEARKKL